MSSETEAVVDGEPEPACGDRRRKALVAVAAVIVTAGTAIAVCTAARRPGRDGGRPPVTQVGLFNVVSRPHVYRPVLRAGARRHRARPRRARDPEARGAPRTRRHARLGP